MALSYRFDLLVVFGFFLGLAACSLPEEPNLPGFYIQDGIIDNEGLKHESIATSNGHQLAYLRYGDPNGQRVIFLHGTPGDKELWTLMMAHPPKGFEIIAVDRPGWGETTPRKAVPSLKQQSEALSVLLDTPGRPTPIVVGWSYGGPVAVEMAADYPDRVSGLLLVAASLDPSLEKTYFIQYLGRALAWVIPAYFDITNKELMALERDLEELSPRMQEVSQPVEIVHGTADQLVPYDNVAFMEHAFGAAQSFHVQTIDGGIHQIPPFATEHMWAAILRLAGRDEEARVREDHVPQNCGGIALHCLPEGVEAGP